MTRSQGLGLGLPAWTVFVLAWLFFGGYFLLGTITVRSQAGRVGLIAIWLLFVVAFALAGRPEPIQPYPG